MQELLHIFLATAHKHLAHLAEMKFMGISADSYERLTSERNKMISRKIIERRE